MGQKIGETRKAFPVGRRAGETVIEAGSAALFAEADLVVAPHGAPRANSIYCKPGTTLVEMPEKNQKRK